MNIPAKAVLWAATLVGITVIGASFFVSPHPRDSLLSLGMAGLGIIVIIMGSAWYINHS